jgi:hypothetical protein
MLKKCKNSQCQQSFQPPKNNLQQEYCSSACWAKSNHVGEKHAKLPAGQKRRTNSSV